MAPAGGLSPQWAVAWQVNVPCAGLVEGGVAKDVYVGGEERKDNE